MIQWLEKDDDSEGGAEPQEQHTGDAQEDTFVVHRCVHLAAKAVTPAVASLKPIGLPQ